MDNVTLTGVGGQQSSVIHCVSEFGIIAINVQNLTISSLHFSGCRAPLRPATLFLLFASNVSILYTHVYNSKGAGMVAVNTFDLILYRTSFVGNIPNCVIWFSVVETLAKLQVSLYIADSEFGYGKSDLVSCGGGLSLIFFQTSYTVYVNIVNVTMYNNTGIVHGNFIMTINEGSSKYTMVHTENIRSSNHLRPTHSGFTVLELVSPKSVSSNQGNHSQQFKYTLQVLNSYFETSMDGSAVHIRSQYKGNSNLRVKFTNITIFYHNHKESIQFLFEILDVSLVVMEKMNVTNSISEVLVMNSKIIIHDAFINKNKIEGIWGVVTLVKSQVTFLGDTVFTQNYGYDAGAIYARSSTLIFLGNVDFVDNTGYNGGALSLYAGSQIVIGRHATLKFIGNHAKYFGGAIYVGNANHQMFSTFTVTCFYQLVDTFNTSVNPHVVFENNTADYAGNVLYGGWIDFCTYATEDQVIVLSGPAFDSLFQVNERESKSSVIASNPLRVCMCIDSRPECSITQYNISAYPGTTIRIPAVAVGQRFGTVPSTVHSGFLHELADGVQPNIQDWQHTQNVEKNCTNLTYTIMSPSQVNLTMTVQIEYLDTPDIAMMQVAGRLRFQNKPLDPSLYFTNLLIHIETLFCHSGFEYDNKSMTCKCDSKLVQYGITCSINTQTIQRKRSFWITTAEGGVLSPRTLSI